MNIQKTSVTTKELREFGLIFGAIFVSLFGLLLPWLIDKPFPIWPWWVFLVSASLAIIYPLSLKPFYKLWMAFGGVMAWINTRLILGIVFYLVFLPFGLVLKLLGKDPLSRKINNKLESYRVINDQNIKSNMEDPY